MELNYVVEALTIIGMVIKIMKFYKMFNHKNQIKDNMVVENHFILNF